MKHLLSFLVIFVFITPVCFAENNSVTISTDSQYRYIKSNGIPDHTPGQFPNSRNPNTISVQDYKFRVPLNPKLTGRATPVPPMLFGVAINGVPFDPGTAEYYNNDRGSGWNYEALSGKINLGLDLNNAHVQPTGAYHYHGIPKPLKNGNKLVAYAADGFPVYISSSLKPSYRLKEGTRPSGPGGQYDGTFTKDYEYVEGLGDLDVCNGRRGTTAYYPNETYYYVLTDTFPYIPRCFQGTPDTSFRHQLRAGMRRDNQGNGNDRMPQGKNKQRGNRQPPQEAISACQAKSEGQSCSFNGRHGRISGSCGNVGRTLACKPKGGPPPMRR